MPPTCEKCGKVHALKRCARHRKRPHPDAPYEPCGNWRVRGSRVCRMHGAKSLKGPAAPSFKHGRFSDVLPRGWADRTREMIDDPGLLELRDHIAVTDQMIRMELQKIGEAGSAIALKRAVRAMKSLDKATANRDGKAAQESYAELKEAISGVSAEMTARNELHRLLDQRRRLGDSEAKRVEKMKAFVTVEQLTTLAYRFVDLASQLVNRFGSDVARLLEDRKAAAVAAVLEAPPAPGVSLEVVEAIARQVVAELALADDIRAAGRRSLSDVAAEIQHLGEAEGASEVDPAEVN